MAKSSKDTAASAEAKARAAADPAATRNLVRLLNILALLLAITAFLLQLFAVLTPHWKWQLTNAHSLLADGRYHAPVSAYDDSRIDQHYGLYCRNVKVYANHDEQLDTWASTRFPRADSGETDLHQCLAQTSTLRGAFLTCSDRLNSPENCHCRRYPHWNAVIFFEIAALILLGLVVVICSLLTTHLHALLKPIGVALSFLAFLFLLIGLIIILSTLKRETRSIADAYPHVHSRLVGQIDPRYSHGHHKLVRRQAHETYRLHNLQPGQRGYNDTHFIEYSEREGQWIAIPYRALDYRPTQPYPTAATYAPRAQQVVTQTSTTTQAVLSNPYGPATGYADVYERTSAYIGCSTVLSILAMILALLIPAILAYSFLTSKRLVPEVKTVTTTTVKTEYVPVPQEVHVETVPLSRPVHADVTARQGPYDNYGSRPEPVVVRDVVIRDDHPTTHTYRT